MVSQEKATIPSVEEITRAEFDALLDQYPAVIGAMSAAKRDAKHGSRRTLAELDQFRYVDAPARFTLPDDGVPPTGAMGFDNVTALAEWKLRHGTFRPKLLSLVASNSPALVQRTICDAVNAYRSSVSATVALDALTKLAGIGPATASLLLAMHDPKRIIFFSDEAFRWLCRGGDTAPPICYTRAECNALSTGADRAAQRLAVSAVQLEKVAYVLMRRGVREGLEPNKTKPGGGPGRRLALAKKRRERSPGLGARISLAACEGDDEAGSVRRSKRLLLRRGREGVP